MIHVLVQIDVVPTAHESIFVWEKKRESKLKKTIHAAKQEDMYKK